MAFQPIVDVSTRSVYAYEALVRGPGGESAASVLSNVTLANKFLFEQSCRRKSIEQAAALGMATRLSINFLPSAIQDADGCLGLTLSTADRCGFPLHHLMFEVVEGENYTDIDHVKTIFQSYRNRGFTTAIDDFGAGFAGFGAIIEMHPHVVKIDMSLIRNIDKAVRKQIVVGGIVAICSGLGARPLAEGVETFAEFQSLRKLGIDLFQGFWFARPSFNALPEVAWLDLHR